MVSIPKTNIDNSKKNWILYNNESDPVAFFPEQTPAIILNDIANLINKHKEEQDLIKRYKEVEEAYKRFQFVLNLHKDSDGEKNDR